ncbi:MULTISPECIES: arginine N-succinyltransferase [Marinobacter]|uniref:Arginine N-succinyltransferase n=1 Tax=Marinobacter metalliresistant TaxID=2961995 RepID=A0ABZ2W645_9GAMM|nr:arginine N-succinyltransferase [Marinobacter sp. Arc7-DN-1]AXS82733.1 arginine N-succinyltransferase [Marinobacter sp. Arc7-DN-1]
MIIRPITPWDLDALYRIAVESGPGFTSLLPDRDALARKIDHSVSSFARPVTAPGDEHYLFVLEDNATGEILGTTGIEAAAGLNRPLVHFRRNAVIQHANVRRMRHTEESLTRCQHYTGCTEICSLYLRPGFRRANAGKLLSRVRFLFMALHPERFSDTVIAEMRGVSDQAGRSPFWDWLKHHVADLDFASATQLACTGHTGFIEEFIPAMPFYTQQMSHAARAVIGQVHEDTRPARHMLEREGFRHQGFVDLLDGGPTLECPKAEIASVRNTHMGKVQLHAGTKFPENDESAGYPSAIVANASCSDFRATVTDQAYPEPGAGRVVVAARLAEHLALGDGSPACCLPLAATRQQSQPGQQTRHTHATEEIHYAY